LSLIEKLKGKVFYGKVTTDDLVVNSSATIDSLSVSSGLSVSGDVSGAKEQVAITMPLTADVINHIVFVANDTYKVTDVREVHATAETTSTGTTLTIERLQGTEAPGAGDALLESSGLIDIKGTANTVQQGVLVSSTKINLAVGDRLGIVIDGATNEIAGSAVTIEIEKL
jgi:hypothetical protein